MAKCNGCIHNAVCVEWSEEGLFPNISRSPLNRARQDKGLECPFFSADVTEVVRCKDGEDA